MSYSEKVSDANALIDAFHQSKKACYWKESVQRYEINLLANVRQTQKELQSGTYKQQDFYEFKLNERGHQRHIKAMHIYDRVVQRSVCDNVLIPALTKYLIHDNGASMKGKGIDFTRKRFEQHLRQFYRQHGNDGYILQIDYSKFFDNIRHEPLIKAMTEKIDDPEIMKLVAHLIDAFKVDVSFTDKDLYDEVFNALEYAEKVPKEAQTGEKYMRKSLGIGSQISQISGIFYPTKVDNYCKIVRGCKYYGRYMDDVYAIHHDKAYLKGLLDDIISVSAEIGLYINPKKTHIVKLSHGFTFLKTKYYLTDTGKIVKRLSRSNITRQRQKLKKFRKLVDEGKMTMADVENQYKSWMGMAKNYDSFHTRQSMMKLYGELFPIHEIYHKK